MRIIGLDLAVTGRAGSFEHPFGFWGPEAAWKPSDRALSA